MSFTSDIDSCVTAGGFPAPSQVFSGANLTKFVSVCGTILKVAQKLGVNVTFADLPAAAALTPAEADAAEVVAAIAAMAGTLVVSTYIGACLTCAGKVAFADGLGAELAAADDGEAKDLAMTAMNDAASQDAAASGTATV
jgi:hypothetical protein